jgi:hypothetical protein
MRKEKWKMDQKEMKKKTPHQLMSEENNGLSGTQEVLYQKEFNQADAAWRSEDKNEKNNQ